MPPVAVRLRRMGHPEIGCRAEENGQRQMRGILRFAQNDKLEEMAWDMWMDCIDVWLEV